VVKNIPELTCNERSECESRTTKPCHCDELAKKQSICPQAPSHFVIRDSSPKHKDLTCNERSECESRTTKPCHPEQSEGSPLCYFSGKRFISPTKMDKIMWALILIHGLKPKAKNLNQCSTSFQLVVCKLKLFYKLPACRKDSANNDFHNNNKKTGV